ncbi:DUF1697 domain-containing protein [Nocardioides ferulae]|uniref:DUF1697 domain-containing protein n=1 Tax=Nocardioides ferulae TaxID=2340821 RepID=UPI001F0B9C4D|nr:DUF1697 domain-containing protein [Nocardioides ferulae]
MRPTTYVAFLRAINLGAKRKFPKADIARAVEAAGGARVETYINTGNVRLDFASRSVRKVETALEAAFHADRGFEVPTIVLRPAELVAIDADAERFAAEHPSDQPGRHYVSLLKQAPDDEALEAFRAAVAPLQDVGQLARVGGRAVHLMIDGDYHTSQLTNALVERHLGVATNRNLTVLRTLAGRWGESSA